MFAALLLGTALIATVSGYKILVFAPQLGHSHVSFMGHIADTLAEAGNDVTMFVPGINDNVTTTGAKVAKVMKRPRNFESTFVEQNAFVGMWEDKGESFSSLYRSLMGFREVLVNFCQSLCDDHQLISNFRKENYDLVIGIALNPCTFGFLELIDARSFIIAFPTTFMEAVDRSFGVDSIPSYVPAAFAPFSDEMTYLQRVRNVAVYVGSNIFMKLFMSGRLTQMFSETIGRPFEAFEIGKRSTFVFVNSEEFTEFPRPINHKFVFVGGIGVTKPKPLDEKLQNVMESSKKGAVLVSFGSFAKSDLMPDWMKQAFIDAFIAFPEITFIWKYESEDDWGKNVKNLVKLKWTPQNDLLGHPKMLAFVTHGGMNSITESTHAGVPLVCVPLFGDQMRNAKMLEKREVAYILDKQNITKQSLADAFRTVVYDPKYREASKRLAKMISRKPISVKDRVIRFAEFAAEFGRIPNLNPAMVELSFVQYYMLDIILPFLIACLLWFYVWIRILFCLFRRCCSRSLKQKTD